MEALKSIAPTDPTEDEIPSASVVARLKASLPGRDLHRIEMRVADSTVLVFVMTGPTKAEWKKYQDDLQRVTGDPDKQAQVVENVTLQQVRWPDREELRQVFDKYPALILNFPEQLNELAGLEVQATRKKL